MLLSDPYSTPWRGANHTVENTRLVNNRSGIVWQAHTHIRGKSTNSVTLLPYHKDLKIATRGLGCGQSILLAKSVNKGCRGHQVISHGSHCQRCTLSRWKRIRCWHQTAEVHAKGIISLSPDKMNLPIQSAKFINFQIFFFSLISRNLFMFNYLVCFLQHSYISCLLPDLFRTVLQSWESVSWA